MLPKCCAAFQLACWFSRPEHHPIHAVNFARDHDSSLHDVSGRRRSCANSTVSHPSGIACGVWAEDHGACRSAVHIGAFGYRVFFLPADVVANILPKILEGSKTAFFRREIFTKHFLRLCDWGRIRCLAKKVLRFPPAVPPLHLQLLDNVP